MIFRGQLSYRVQTAVFTVCITTAPGQKLRHHEHSTHHSTTRLPVTFCHKRIILPRFRRWKNTQSCEEQKKKHRRGSICHFSPVTCASDVYADRRGTPLILLLTSTKTKQFAWNDWWVLIFWEQQSQQMTVRKSKLSYLFIFDKPHSYRKLSNIKWDTNVFVRRRDRRRETAEWLAARLCTRAQWVTLPRHDEVLHCHLLSAQSSSRAFLGYGSSSLQSHCGSLLKSRLCLVSATYGI